MVTDNPIEKIFERWGSEIEKVVGKGNYCMDDKDVPAKFTKFAQMTMLGDMGKMWDLEGNETHSTITIQIDSYCTGQKSLTNSYKLDHKSHEIMSGMGFRRTSGAVHTKQDGVHRVVSRYMLNAYGGSLK